MTVYEMTREVTPDRVRQIRTAMKMSQEQFSEVLLVSRQTVSNWESGRYPICGPAVVALNLLADQFVD